MLGATDDGLTGSDTGDLLSRSKVPHVCPGTKRYRLRDSLVARQYHDKAANCVVRFITEAMRNRKLKKEAPSPTALVVSRVSHCDLRDL